jgi:diguanylate cyclase (GGDEF)-like protein
MTDNIVYLLALLVAANIILIGVALARAVVRGRRARREATVQQTSTTRPVSGATASAAGTDRAPTLVTTRDATQPSPRTDPLTGLLLPAEWNRVIFDEAARIHRYGRPATVVFIDLDGLDRLTELLGPGAAERILPALADVLSRQARGSDHVARLGSGRFGVLLPETGEVEAVNYVERVRAACELWLESGAIAMRLAIGWAAPPREGGSLEDAFALAQDRMFTELRRGERRAADRAPEGPGPRHDFGGSPSPA